MFRLSGVVFFLFSMLLGAGLFWTSQSVQRVQYDLTSKNQLYVQEREALRVLTSEWSYLNRPGRLEALIVGDDSSVSNVHNSVGVVSGVSFVPEPLVPVVPSVKPAYAGGTVLYVTEIESNSFDDLLSGLSTLPSPGGNDAP